MELDFLHRSSQRTGLDGFEQKGTKGTKDGVGWMIVLFFIAEASLLRGWRTRVGRLGSFCGEDEFGFWRFVFGF